MNVHIHEWLDAYIDGELPQNRRQQVEIHLQHCPDCRSLLEQRRALSALLQSAPPAADLKPVRQFTAEVNLQLQTRRPVQTGPRQPTALAWLLFPVSLLLLIGLVRTTLIVADLVSLIPGFQGALQGQAAQLSSSFSLPEPYGALAIIHRAISFPLPDGLIAWLLLGALGLVYLAWLAGWWTNNRQNNN